VKSSLRLELHAPFNLEATLFSGQAFRWEKLESAEGHPVFQGVVYGEVLQICHNSSTVLTVSSSADQINGLPLQAFASDYLGLDEDIDNAFSPSFCQHYPDLYEAIRQYHGTRTLRQEPFEILISFMCAQGLGVSLIRRQISKLSLFFGKDISITEYKFPSPEQLACADLNTLIQCTNNNSIRAKNIKTISQAITDKELDLNKLIYPNSSFDEARRTLLSYPGIGEKIADCVCLFGLRHCEAFPIDTHVRQYLEHWFNLRPATTTLTSSSYRELAEKARQLLGHTQAGLAGHLLFHYWRLHVRGMKEV
jgi:N-glycosylase/DNA lyase